MSTAPILRADVLARLRTSPADELAAVLAVGGVAAPADADGPTLAELLVSTLWRRTHSPTTGLVLPKSLDGLVDRMARKLALDLPEGDGWVRLQALTERLVPGGRVDDLGQLSPEQKARLKKRLWPAWTGVAGGASAAGSRYAALRLLQWTTGPLWDLLLFVPSLGPVFAAIRTGLVQVARVSAPVGIALALLSLDQAFGPEDDRALPLLLGLGLLVGEAVRPVDVIEVPAPPPPAAEEAPPG